MKGAKHVARRSNKQGDCTRFFDKRCSAVAAVYIAIVLPDPFRRPGTVCLAERNSTHSGLRGEVGDSVQLAGRPGSNRAAGVQVPSQDDSVALVRAHLEGNLFNRVCMAALENPSDHGCCESRYYVGVDGSRISAADSVGPCMAAVRCGAWRSVALDDQLQSGGRPPHCQKLVYSGCAIQAESCASARITFCGRSGWRTSQQRRRWNVSSWH